MNNKQQGKTIVVTDPLEASIIQDSNINTEIKTKSTELYRSKVRKDYENLQESIREDKKVKSINIVDNNPELLKARIESNALYFEGTRNSKVFLNNDFKGKIPFFSTNIILIVASTGSGKSTVCANTAIHTIKQGGNVLVITNEEVESDIYNRVTCLIKGWAYTNHERMTKEQVLTFGDYMKRLSPKLTVIGDSYMGGMGQTTTIEGMEAILASVVRNGGKYDLIVIDYYQNVSTSLKNPHMKDWEVQKNFAKLLDRYRLLVNSPIILLAQQREGGADLSFKESIEGSKSILNPATCAIELKAEHKDHRTSWTIKKSRFPASLGETIYTGYEKGKYVSYNAAFKNKIEQWRQAEETKNLRSGIRPENYNNKRDKNDSNKKKK